MPPCPFDQMQRAVDVVNTSPHPVNKIAATVFGRDAQGAEYSLSRTNHWPAAIESRLGQDREIGNSSGTIHAETACILAAPGTDGASLCVTDPFCPNCAKNIAEAGVRVIYIDNKGFSKDFAARRGADFENMSMRICERAGISVYQVWRKEKRLEAILETPEGYRPREDSPLEIETLTESPTLNLFAAHVEKMKIRHRGRKFACTLARDKATGRTLALTARTHPAPGFSMERDAALINDRSGKYSYILEPVNRLLMGAARIGAMPVSGLMFCTDVPTARELVNMAGAGLAGIYIQNPGKARDEGALEAMTVLQKAGIIDFKDAETLLNSR